MVEELMAEVLSSIDEPSPTAKGLMPLFEPAAMEVVAIICSFPEAKSGYATAG